MKYSDVTEGIFIERPNRFIAEVMISGKQETVHVMNTGRMKELLVPGAEVFLQRSANTERKTKYDLIGVKSGERIINIDSIAPNKAAAEYIPRLFPDFCLIRPETTHGDSRFDFYIETPTEKIFLEVKGVTLRVGTEARFPDAPTERGTKHLRGLIRAKAEGFRACLLFVVAMKGCLSFSPNAGTDPKFASALAEAKSAGVEIYAAECFVSEDEIIAEKEIPVNI